MVAADLEFATIIVRPSLAAPHSRAIRSDHAQPAKPKRRDRLLYAWSANGSAPGFDE
jgi:hypothetical protein